MSHINCQIENLRILLESKVHVNLISSTPNQLTLEILNPLELAALATQISNSNIKIDSPWGQLNILRVLSNSPPNLLVETAENIGTNPPQPLKIDSNWTGQECYIGVSTSYSATVDEINDISIQNKSGTLESRQIRLEGRWTKEAPKLVHDNKYSASLLTDGGMWTMGTFKHINRTRSRFGLESYFGSPVLGLFTPIINNSPRDLVAIESDELTLSQAKINNQFNYQKWL